MRADGIVVSLEGHGGDELLGGYAMHIAQACRGAAAWRLLLDGPSI
jgi:asparagine synthetase B (glutamine-hydrolysing)